MRVDPEDAPPFVIKQCRERLRVAMDWHARLDRIWAERAALDVLGSLLPAGTVPQVFFEDRPNYLFAMTCAPDDSETWKTHLMNGRADPRIAGRLGTILGTIHAEAPDHPELRGTLADTSLFDELRLDPYYRTTARAHPEIAPRIEALIAAMDVPPRRSARWFWATSAPRTSWCTPAGLILLDFECAHGGDATFDLGFFLSHLVLKTIHLASGRAGRPAAVRGFDAPVLGRLPGADRRRARGGPRAWCPARSSHTAACLLARVDGKSPVEYLDPAGQELARRLALEALETRPRTWDEMLGLLERQLHGQ